MIKRSQLVQRFVGLFLTQKMRRMIVVVSAATYLHTLDRSGRYVLADLNKEAKLSHDPKALNFPAKLTGVVWGRSVLSQVDLTSGRDSMLTKLLQSVPCCLRYGNDEVMLEDLSLAVSHTGM